MMAGLSSGRSFNVQTNMTPDELIEAGCCCSKLSGSQPPSVELCGWKAGSTNNLVPWHLGPFFVSELQVDV